MSKISFLLAAVAIATLHGAQAGYSQYRDTDYYNYFNYYDTHDHEYTFEDWTLWHLIIPTCVVPYEIANGYFIVDRYFFTPGNTITFKCNDRFKLVGNATITCGLNGWVGERPKCIPTYKPATTCSGIKNLEKGYVRSVKKLYRVGEEVKFHCRHKYYLKGNDTLTCTDKGWDYEQPVCNRHDCTSRKCGPNAVCSMNRNRVPICVCKIGYRKRAFGKCTLNEECPANMHYEMCGSSCPPSCEDQNPTCIRACAEGCFCDKGYILSNGTCVPKSECKCMANGRTYEDDETYIAETDCGYLCTCMDGGSFSCKDHTCKVNEKCVVHKKGGYKCQRIKEPVETTAEPITETTEETITETTTDEPKLDACVAKNPGGKCICQVAFASFDSGKTCDPICPMLVLPLGMVTSPSKESYKLGETVKFTCLSESGVAEMGDATCLENHTWSRSVPSCNTKP